MKRAALAPALVHSLCRVNEGVHQCRWLARDQHGFLCAKHDDPRRARILEHERYGMLDSMGDHCAGIHPWTHSENRTMPIEVSHYEPGSLIFVFGSNLAGRHGAGAALHAVQFFGARYGEGEGLTGRAYGIPTKDRHLNILPLESIRRSVGQFIEFAMANPQMTFLITAIGCGLAGYEPAQIAPMFVSCPENCYVTPRWLMR